MDIDRYLLAAAFIQVIAQRLVRTICPKCVEECPRDEAKVKYAELDGDEYKDMKFYRGRGCDNCKGTGMKGRAAVYEILDIDDEIRAMVAGGQSLYEIKKVGLAKGMSTIRGSTIRKMQNAQTTIDELIKVSAA
ncbi:MAG TPA: hypothetical protein PKK26_09385, partial [Candidatus Wallbacteria bacterium]|nr:hypothetical protein [Candidatus Wallbacteria bacterium]